VQGRWPHFAARYQDRTFLIRRSCRVGAHGAASGRALGAVLLVFAGLCLQGSLVSVEVVRTVFVQQLLEAHPQGVLLLLHLLLLWHGTLYESHCYTFDIGWLVGRSVGRWVGSFCYCRMLQAGAMKESKPFRNFATTAAPRLAKELSWP
jgi:hypothetical protein